MDNTSRKQITDYLSGPREYQEGVALYQRYGSNLRLKRVFATDDTNTTKEILFEELRKLAGLSEAEYVNLPRLAVSTKSRLLTDETILDISPKSEEASETAASSYEAAPEPIRRMIKLREKYPFLNSPDCPDILKVLVSDMVTAYYRYKEAHARLQTLPDDETSAAMADCENVINSYLDNREIREELDYYKETGEILGKAAKFREMEVAEDFGKLSEIELMKQLNSASANESKHRKNVNMAKDKGETNDKAEAALARWSARKAALQEEVARRKKN